MKILVLSKDRTAQFAAQELCRILLAVANADTKPEFRTEYCAQEEGLWLGTLSCFPQITPKLQNPDAIDDEIYIETQGTHGIIAGLHPRSLLIAVYRFVTEIGCRFLGIGPEGEYFPSVCVAETKVSLHEVPSYRHRGVCIEGAVSADNVIEMVDLLPKLGMNSYFIQFREAYTFFERWYRHRRNPLLESKEEYPVKHAQDCVAHIAEEMDKRGIVYHAVGHGWTCEPFGIPGLAWEEWTQDIPEETLENFAMIDGKRQLFHGVPLNTSACYGNPEVRAAMVKNIYEYIEDHPTLDVIHVWLADAENNQCECEQCQKHLPADWYIQLLNELDALLTKHQKDTKIVFLLYEDLLWPPKVNTFSNPSRFILMFAPITRSYRESFAVRGALPEIPEYQRNKNTLPTDVAKNVAFLAAWQKLFSGDGFDYDYHFMWAHLDDPGLLKICEILHDDICRLSDIGLNGYISCQVGRVMFPNALNMVTMGRTLWNKNISYDTVVKDYFSHAYGEYSDLVYSYCSHLSKLYFDLNLESHVFETDASRAALCRDAIAYLKSVSLPENKGFFWEALRCHRKYWLALTEVLLLLFEGKTDQLQTAHQAFLSCVWDLEPKVQPIFDGWNFSQILSRYCNLFA